MEISSCSNKPNPTFGKFVVSGCDVASGWLEVLINYFQTKIDHRSKKSFPNQIVLKFALLN